MNPRKQTPLAINLINALFALVIGTVGAQPVLAIPVIGGPEVLPSEKYPVTEADLAFGEKQLEQLLMDRPQMAKHVKKGDPVWTWIIRQFAGEHTGVRYRWNNTTDDESFDDTIACNNSFKHWIAVVSKKKNGPEEKPDKMWAAFIFECFNIRNNRDFEILWDEVLALKVSKEEFAHRSAKLEYNALREQSAFFKNVWAPHVKEIGEQTYGPYWRENLPPTYEQWITEYQKRVPAYLAYYGRSYEKAVDWRMRRRERARRDDLLRLPPRSPRRERYRGDFTSPSGRPMLPPAG